MKPTPHTPELSAHQSYYQVRASSYQSSEEMEFEHTLSICAMAGIAKKHGWVSFLDVGAGSGRGMILLNKLIPDVAILGIEPVEALREIALKRQLPGQIVEGNATSLQYPNLHFDCVYATGILHHIAKPRLALSEMWRVTKHALVLSDLNNFGCGGPAQKAFSHALRFIRLWTTFQFIKNGFKHEKFSVGDGTHYSYSLFDDIPFLESLGAKVYLLTTRPTHGSPFSDSSHVCLIAMKNC